MKVVRRFQRTMFTVLFGINIFVFTYSFHGKLGLACWYACSAMIIAAAFLLLVSYINRYNQSKKKFPVTPSSKQN